MYTCMYECMYTHILHAPIPKLERTHLAMSTQHHSQSAFFSDIARRLLWPVATTLSLHRIRAQRCTRDSQRPPENASKSMEKKNENWKGMDRLLHLGCTSEAQRHEEHWQRRTLATAGRYAVPYIDKYCNILSKY